MKEGSLIDVIKADSDNEEGRLVATAIFRRENAEGASEREFCDPLPDQCLVPLI